MRRTKIVCTIGPATSSPEALRELAGAGMDVARLNFSHGSHESHGRTIAHCARYPKNWVARSLIRNPRPTRAEVTDVANAILDCTDAIMLNPIVVSTPEDADDLMQVCIDAANKSGLVRDNDFVVITGGVPVGRSGSTNLLRYIKSAGRCGLNRRIL